MLALRTILARSSISAPDGSFGTTQFTVWFLRSHSALPAVSVGALGSALAPGEAAVSIETEVAHAGSAKLSVTLVAVFSAGTPHVRAARSQAIGTLGLEEGLEGDGRAEAGGDAVGEEGELAVGREEGEVRDLAALLPPHALVEVHVVDSHGRAAVGCRGWTATDAQAGDGGLVVEPKPHLRAPCHEAFENNAAVDVALSHISRPVRDNSELLNEVDEDGVVAPL
eukprot:CAMPEP_0196723896 /NCGR_PEP_ID=MMETSP1091-20130531/5947_1 /TAXON_ID=302021 /ORGANISM="Rhodomonas sp., Strain CCMP768" /LENGTH=224 /DNA_ID=CAMNT_0042065941 /DNA_START=273 /DNA_END=949 /DNA_ORIENTATION=-